jgi:hypothetical protein
MIYLLLTDLERCLQGTILVSFDTDPAPGEDAYLAVYRSTDGGRTFSAFSRVVDTQGHGPMRYQSHLFLLDTPFGGLPAGTVLLAGNAVPDSHKTSMLDLYVSHDDGLVNALNECDIMPTLPMFPYFSHI